MYSHNVIYFFLLILFVVQKIIRTFASAQLALKGERADFRWKKDVYETFSSELLKSRKFESQIEEAMRKRSR